MFVDSWVRCHLPCAGVAEKPVGQFLLFFTIMILLNLSLLSSFSLLPEKNTKEIGENKPTSEKGVSQLLLD